MRFPFLAGLLATAAAHNLPVTLETKRAVDSGLANIHVRFDAAFDELLSYTYGSCQSRSPDDCHHQVSQGHGLGHDRLLWKIPESARPGGCLSAWDASSRLVGRSSPVAIEKKIRKRTVIPMDNSSRIDAQGPWFDGVELLKNKEVGAVDVKAAKAKDVAIIGAGMAGLMTWLCLHQAGFKNLHITEAAQRLGGRMGPMRFPKSITSGNTTYDVNDHKLVFDLAAEVNKLNGNNKNFSVDFIKWYQSSQAGLQCAGTARKADGSCPTLADVTANASFTLPTPALAPDVQALTTKINDLLGNSDLIRSIATNMFAAHKAYLDDPSGDGGDSWSELAYMHNYLGYSLNATDQVIANLLSGSTAGESFWETLFEETYFMATDWRTIDGGLSRLPSAFHPLVDSITSINRTVSKMTWDSASKKVSVFWKEGSYTAPLQSKAYDYAITTVPFALMRHWQLPQFGDPVKQNAIDEYGYSSVCKVALQFKTRFWEHFAQPIYGSCSTTTDIPGIGSICYPSYDINSTGPGVMLASYSGTDSGLRWASVSEAEHVAYVLAAMAEIHGDVVNEQYTGEFNRRCWILDPYETISWAQPTLGQRQLYIPSFFKTENGVIIGGEGSSFTSSWISSALESGVRSSVQLMLELGLVDEAKQTVEKWMARWISI